MNVLRQQQSVPPKRHQAAGLRWLWQSQGLALFWNSLRLGWPHLWVPMKVHHLYLWALDSLHCSRSFHCGWCMHCRLRCCALIYVLWDLGPSWQPLSWLCCLGFLRSYPHRHSLRHSYVGPCLQCQRCNPWHTGPQRGLLQLSCWHASEPQGLDEWCNKEPKWHEVDPRTSCHYRSYIHFSETGNASHCWDASLYLPSSTVMSSRDIRFSFTQIACP